MNREYIVVAFTENQVGVLNRITASYLRRKINIESLKVSESAIRGISMFVISAITTDEVMDKTVKQIRNIIDVLEVGYYDAAQLISQEIALYKISTVHLDKRDHIEEITARWKMRVIEINMRYVVLEKTGTREEIETLRAELESEDLLEGFTRSGSVVMLPDAPSIFDK